MDTGIKFNPSNLKPDPHAFIFSFRNGANRPVKINVWNKSQAIYCHDMCGPSFGQFDFLIKTNANTNLASFSNLGASYLFNDYVGGAGAGAGGSHTFLAGTKNFQVVEIEVFHRDEATSDGKKEAVVAPQAVERSISRAETPGSAVSDTKSFIF